MPFSSMGDDLDSRSFWAAALHVVCDTFTNAWCSVVALLVIESVSWEGGSAARGAALLAVRACAVPSGAASLPCDLQGSPAPPLKWQLAGLRLSTWAPSPRTKRASPWTPFS